MKHFVSNPRVGVVTAVASLSMLWAIFVVPGGAPWAGYVWLSALAVLFVATAVLLVAAPSPSSIVQVVPIDAEPKAADPMSRR